MGQKSLIRTLCLALFLFCCTSFAANAFRIKHIEIQGNQRVSRATILSYLPIARGDHFDPNESAEVLKSLYKTGFFDQVSIARRDHTLVIQVKERPVISGVNISGNKLIKTKQIKAVLRQAGIQEGEVIDPSNLEDVRHALLQQYYNQGYYTAKVNVNVQHPAPERAVVNLTIDEGSIAKIAKIKIIGNHQYTDSQLLKQFKLSSTGFWSFFTKSDQYSRQKLEADLNRLTHFYMDRGYLNFSIEHTQVAITPNKRHVYITVKVHEGQAYKVGDVRVVGKLPEDIQASELQKRVKIQKGDWFSRRKVVDSEQNIGEYLNDHGYANAQITPQPRIKKSTRRVGVDFHIRTGKHVYANQVRYQGNTKTQDSTLRKQMRQVEGGLLQNQNVKETKRKMDNLGFIKHVKAKTTSVSTRPDLQNVVYSFDESASTTFNIQVAFSDTYGIMYGADVTDKNFRGTGKHLSLKGERSQYSTNFMLNYYNPNYTLSGVSRGFNLHSSRKTPDKIKLSDFTLDTLGGGVTYGIPLSEYSQLEMNFDYDRYSLEAASNAALEIRNFRQKHGSRFNGFKPHIGWYRSTLNRLVLPTKGTRQSLDFRFGLPLGGESLEYYKLTYRFTGWQPLIRNWVLHGRFSVGHGDGYGTMDDLPFFLNYYTGGIHTVRGYEGNTLGPKDSRGKTIGGNTFTDFSIGLVLPPFKEYLRATVFLDGGNTFDNRFDLSDLRYSAGVQVEWLTPIGASLILSVAEPLNEEPQDKTEIFQFSIGTSF